MVTVECAIAMFSLSAWLLAMLWLFSCDCCSVYYCITVVILSLSCLIVCEQNRDSSVRLIRRDFRLRMQRKLENVLASRSFSLIAR